MVYKRRSFKKRTFKRARKLNYRQKKQVKRMIGNDIELKHYDIGFTASVSSTGSIQGPFGTPIQGIDEDERVGDQIMLKKYLINAMIAVGDTTNVVRIVFFRWTPNTLVTTPVVGDVFPSLANGPLSQLNETNIENGVIRIVYDKIYALSSTGNNAVITRRYSFYGKKLGKKKFVFNPSLTSGVGHLYLCILSDSIAAPNPTVTMASRLIYSDA